MYVFNIGNVAQGRCVLNTPQAWDVFIQQFANSFPNPGTRRYQTLNNHIRECASMIRAQGLDRCLGRIGEVAFESYLSGHPDVSTSSGTTRR